MGDFMSTFNAASEAYDEPTEAYCMGFRDHEDSEESKVDNLESEDDKVEYVRGWDRSAELREEEESGIAEEAEAFDGVQNEEGKWVKRSAADRAKAFAHSMYSDEELPEEEKEGEVEESNGDQISAAYNVFETLEACKNIKIDENTEEGKELYIFITSNDSMEKMLREVYYPNLDKKWEKGTLEAPKARKLMMYAVDKAATAYCQEHCGRGDNPKDIFDKMSREEVADQLFNDWRADYTERHKDVQNESKIDEAEIKDDKEEGQKIWGENPLPEETKIVGVLTKKDGKFAYLDKGGKYSFGRDGKVLGKAKIEESKEEDTRQEGTKQLDKAMQDALDKAKKSNVTSKMEVVEGSSEEAAATVNRLKRKIQGMSEEEAYDTLDNEDLIFASSAFRQTFGHQWSEELSGKKYPDWYQDDNGIIRPGKKSNVTSKMEVVEDKQLDSKMNRLKNSIQGKTEKEAVDILSGIDLIIANHVFEEVFGHQIPKELGEGAVTGSGEAGGAEATSEVLMDGKEDEEELETEQEEENEEIEPDEDDMFVSSNGFKTSLSVNGKWLGDFVKDDDLQKAIKAWIKKSNFYPSIWFVDDHGGIEPYTLEEKVDAPKPYDEYEKESLGKEVGKVTPIKEDSDENKVYSVDELDFTGEHNDIENNSELSIVPNEDGSYNLSLVYYYGTHDNPGEKFYNLGDYKTRQEAIEKAKEVNSKKGANTEIVIEEGYKGSHVHTVTSEDMGKERIKTSSGKTIDYSGGRVLKQDIGKQIFLTGDNVYQVENDEQLKKRLGKNESVDYIHVDGEPESVKDGAYWDKKIEAAVKAGDSKQAEEHRKHKIADVEALNRESMQEGRAPEGSDNGDEAIKKLLEGNYDMGATITNVDNLKGADTTKDVRKENSLTNNKSYISGGIHGYKSGVGISAEDVKSQYPEVDDMDMFMKGVEDGSKIKSNHRPVNVIRKSTGEKLGGPFMTSGQAMTFGMEQADRDYDFEYANESREFGSESNDDDAIFYVENKNESKLEESREDRFIRSIMKY